MQDEDTVESLKRELEFYKSRFDLVIEGSDGGYWDWDIQNGTLYNSPHWFDVIGWKKSSLPEGIERFSTIIHPDDKERVFGVIDDYLHHRSDTYRCEFSILCEDGSIRYLYDRGSAVFDAEGNALRMAGFATDVTDEKLRGLTELRNSRRELERAHRNLEAIFQIIPGQLFVKDKQLRYSEVNEAFLKVVGKSREEVIGKKIAEVFHAAPDLAERYARADDELIEAGYLSYESKIQLPDGSRMDVLINKSILYDQQGAFNGIVGLVTDVGLLKETEHKMEQAFFKAEEANRSKSQFLANMSHEIRTPMNAIIGFSELLELRDIDPTQRHYLQAIKSSSKTLLTLINDILDLSKIEAGKMDLHYQPVEIAKIIEELVDIFSIETQDKGLVLEYQIQQGLPLLLYFDEVRLRQILLNVINNAIKFTKEGFVRIEVRFSALKNDSLTLDIIISDSGIGIALDQQERIFKLFEQQDGQSTREFGGTGLGLSITKNLVELMGGEILLESKAGQGARFTLHFENVVLEESLRQKELIHERIMPEFYAARVLVVDDVTTNRMLLKSLFEGSAIEVIEAIDGADGIEKAKTMYPDLIFMDVRMPMMDGFEAARLIKADPQLEMIPVIALTASVVEKDRKFYVANGFDDFLEKPFEHQHLYAVMKRYLSYNHQTQIVQENRAHFESITKANLQSMLTYLQGDALQKYDQIRHQNSFEVYETWAMELKQAALGLGNDFVQTYAQRILDAIAAFDIELLRREVENYTTIIDTVKRAL